MAFPGGTSMIYLVGMIPMALGLVLHIVGLATTKWSVHKDTDEIYSGLFSGCILTTYSTYRILVCGVYDLKSSKLKACEAFALIGMLLAIAGLVLVLLNVILGAKGKGQNKMFSLLSGVCCFLAFGAVLITVIVWGVGIHDSDEADLGYSFALSVVGGILLLVAGGLVIAGGTQVS